MHRRQCSSFLRLTGAFSLQLSETTYVVIASVEGNKDEKGVIGVFLELTLEQSATGSDVINNIVIIQIPAETYLFSLSFPGL